MHCNISGSRPSDTASRHRPLILPSLQRPWQPCLPWRPWNASQWRNPRPRPWKPRPSLEIDPARLASTRILKCGRRLRSSRQSSGVLTASTRNLRRCTRSNAMLLKTKSLQNSNTVKTQFPFDKKQESPPKKLECHIDFCCANIARRRSFAMHLSRRRKFNARRTVSWQGFLFDKLSCHPVFCHPVFLPTSLPPMVAWGASRVEDRTKDFSRLDRLIWWGGTFCWGVCSQMSADFRVRSRHAAWPRLLNTKILQCHCQRLWVSVAVLGLLQEPCNDTSSLSADLDCLGMKSRFAAWPNHSYTHMT